MQKVSSARAAEAPIQNLVRPRGAPHYGLGRTLHLLFDIPTIRFLLTYLTRPMHFFWKFGLPGTGVLIKPYFESPGRRIDAVREMRCRRGRRAPNEAR